MLKHSLKSGIVRGLLGLLSASCSFKVRGLLRGFPDNEVEDEDKKSIQPEGVANAGGSSLPILTVSRLIPLPLILQHVFVRQLLCLLALAVGSHLK